MSNNHKCKKEKITLIYIMSQTQLPPNTYTPCATENTVCPVPSNEPTLIAYKPDISNGDIYFRGVTGPVDCNNTNFGDPEFNTPKQCLKFTYPTSINTLQYDPVTGLPVATSGFQVCADEGYICDPAKLNPAVSNLPVDVIFGANKHYNYARFVGSAECTSTVFGETSQDKGQRQCLWRPAAPIPLSPSPSPGPSPGPSPSNITPSPTSPPGPSVKSKTGLIITIIIGLVILIIFIIIIALFLKKEHKNK